jgi:hypothetical protein
MGSTGNKKKDRKHPFNLEDHNDTAAMGSTGKKKKDRERLSILKTIEESLFVCVHCTVSFSGT